VPVLVSCVLLLGCKELSPEAKSLLTTAAIQSKSTASAFELIRTLLAPKSGTEADVTALGTLVTAHADGLNAQAKALNDLVQAVNVGSKLSEQTRQQLRAAVETAKGRTDNFRQWSTLVTAKEAVNAERVATWVADHQASLDAVLDTLAKLSAVAPPKPPKAAKAKTNP
jgi:ABC-type transporter Mla subunit MlaD